MRQNQPKTEMDSPMMPTAQLTVASPGIQRVPLTSSTAPRTNCTLPAARYAYATAGE